MKYRLCSIDRLWRHIRIDNAQFGLHLADRVQPPPYAPNYGTLFSRLRAIISSAQQQMSSIVLPRLHRVSLAGFQPLFEEEVDLKLPKGPFLILGGNAMGKTTTLQATVFGLAGGADDVIEDQKYLRWDAKYFRRRLNPGQDTEVRVEFELGSSRIAVTRGIRSDDVRSVKINGDPLIDDTEVATARYESEVIRAGGYNKFSDFRFLVHRLSYLPETRRSIVWDQKAQIRTVMLLCSDRRREMEFRQLNIMLRDLDTEKRHLHVDITRLQTRIERLEVTKETNAASSDGNSEEPHEDLLAESERLRDQFAEVAKRRIAILRHGDNLRSGVITTAQQLQKLQDKLALAEESFTLQTLQEVENASGAIALQKLLVYHLCPYCAQQTNDLAAKARERVERGDCPICTQPYHAAKDAGDVGALRSQIAATNQQIEEYDRHKEEAGAELTQLSRAEQSIRLSLEEIIGKLPPIPKDVVELDVQSVASLRRTLRIYQSQHEKLATRWQETKEAVDAAFAHFADAASQRLESLQKAASDYGYAFLGHDCQFIAVPARAELGTLSFFVPKFADEERRSPETCSESERFFLDIAFRMALLELAGRLSHSSSTFICETPETALDLAYTRNVADMFAKFTKRGFSLLLTANIQPSGVAAPLLKQYSVSERPRRIFNLVEAGILSDVQKESINQFTAELKHILTSR